MKFLPRFVQFLFYFVCINAVYAQDCLSRVFDANKLLNAGKIEDALDLCRNCIHSENSETERWQAYRISALAYLALGQTDSARQCAEKILEINPKYKPNVLKEPRSFVNILDQIVVIPKFSLGLAVSLGTNTTFPIIGDRYVLADYSKQYKNGNSYQFGSNLGFNISPKLELNLGIFASSKKFSLNYNFAQWEVSVSEQLTYLDFPLSIKYIFSPLKKFRIFVNAGIFTDYLLYANNTFSSTQTATGENFELNQLNIIDRRNRWNFGLLGGVGLYYKLKPGHLTIQANYYYSLTQINKNDQRYSFPEQIYTYYYLDDDITLDNLAISIGYTHYLNYRIYRNKSGSK